MIKKVVRRTRTHAHIHTHTHTHIHHDTHTQTHVSITFVHAVFIQFFTFRTHRVFKNRYCQPHIYVRERTTRKRAYIYIIARGSESEKSSVSKKKLLEKNLNDFFYYYYLFTFFFFTISILLIGPKASECCLKIFNGKTPAAVANGRFFLLRNSSLKTQALHRGCR